MARSGTRAACRPPHTCTHTRAPLQISTYADAEDGHRRDVARVLDGRQLTLLQAADGVVVALGHVPPAGEADGEGLDLLGLEVREDCRAHVRG